MFGFDCGTFNLISSHRNKAGEIETKRELNCFLELPLENRFLFNTLKTSKVKVIERENVAYIVGQAAMDMAYTLPQLPLKRPMRDGCLNPTEKDAFSILSRMIHSLLGEVEKDKDIVYYSVPANAINQETDADYHASVLQSIFNAYKVNNKTVRAFPINEGLALVLAELLDKQYTGIGISCLCPGTKIYTDKGLVNIEDVQEGDLVLTHKGRWKPITKVITKQFAGMATKIKINGIENEYRFVDNHELYVKEENGWKWTGCEEIGVGDIVGQPGIKNGGTQENPNIKDDFLISSVERVQYEDYTGIVYDLQVEEDHSFSGPGLTIHNCGAGMINLSYAIFSHPIFQMSLVNSGDWIDKMAAKASGESPTVINKEKTKVDLTKTTGTLMERAIKTQYELLIQKTVTSIKKAIIDAGTKAHSERPLDIILAGGTASPPGFVEMFAESVKEAKWPIPIGEIKRPADHLYTVSKGCLIAAENSQL